MIKTYCDRENCHKEIEPQERQYTTSIVYNDNRPALKPLVLCPFCFVEIEKLIRRKQ